MAPAASSTMHWTGGILVHDIAVEMRGGRWEKAGRARTRLRARGRHPLRTVDVLPTCADTREARDGLDDAPAPYKKRKLMSTSWPSQPAKGAPQPLSHVELNQTPARRAQAPAAPRPTPEAARRARHG